MAGQSPPYYTPISKPTTTTTTANGVSWKRTNLYTWALVTFLCSISYFFGVWQHGGTSSTTSSSDIILPCVLSQKNTTNTVTRASDTYEKALDFQSHHSAGTVIEEGEGDSVKTYPPCDVKYSEYTPCEDPKRSLRFPRDRLIYRERHCPEKNELLKCRIPAPHGYKNPFKWPLSRDLAWYANVPHKELTVEKAVQNWIRYEGDRFRFPGGGTMFPNGADAYIDDIGKLINLKDGSIRTAIDTGCGVRAFFFFFLNSYIYNSSGFPCFVFSIYFFHSWPEMMNWDELLP